MLLCASLFAATLATAQGKQTSGVRAPNEGPARVYEGTSDEVLEAAVDAAERAGLDVTRLGEGFMFLASPDPWARPKKGVTFTKTLIVRLRSLGAKETEVEVSEEGRQVDAATAARLDTFHEQVAVSLRDRRVKTPLVPKHPLENQGDAVVVRHTDLGSTVPSTEAATLRTWNLSRDKTKPVNTSVWKVSGRIPLHVTPLSERRFLVTEGGVHMTTGARTFWLSAGDFASVPKGVRTAIETEAGARATLFVVESPPVDDAKTLWLEKQTAKE